MSSCATRSVRIVVVFANVFLVAGLAGAQNSLPPGGHCSEGDAVSISQAFYPHLFNGRTVDYTDDVDETTQLCQFRMFFEPEEEICFCEHEEAVYAGTVVPWVTTDAAERPEARYSLHLLNTEMSLVWGPAGATVESTSTPVHEIWAQPSEDGPVWTLWTQHGGILRDLAPGFYEVELRYFHPDFGGLYRIDTNHFRVLPHEIAHDLGHPQNGFEGSVVCPIERSCGDGLDNDQDGATDCYDRNCEFLLACLTGAYFDLGSETGSPVHAGDTLLSVDDHVLHCTFLAGAAGDDEFRWTAPADGTYTIDTVGSVLDTVLGVSTENQFFCNEDISDSIWQSAVTLSLVAGEEVVIIVDGYWNDEGPYVLNINQVD